jgi:dihydrofolate synthase / folylpolyglutamate synthase
MKVILVVGTLADKDLRGIVAALAPLAASVIAVEVDHPRARPAPEIAAGFAAAGTAVQRASSVTEGLTKAIDLAGPAGLVCVAGSLYVAAEARAALLAQTVG